MYISQSKLISFIILALLLSICVYIVYQIMFDYMQESFVSLSTTGPFKIEDETKFRNYADMINQKIDNIFPNTTIDTSLNSSLYFKRVNNEDLYFYSENNKYNWDKETIKLYKDFLKSQQISINDNDFNEYVDKLRSIYNQNMILELMSYETDRHKLLTNGVVVDASHNLLQPWDAYTMTLSDSQYIAKCNGNLQKFTSESDSGTDISLNTLKGLSFPNGSCNPCDSLLSPDNVDRYKCKYNLNMKNKNGLTGDDIWNKIWNTIIKI